MYGYKGERRDDGGSDTLGGSKSGDYSQARPVPTRPGATTATPVRKRGGSLLAIATHRAPVGKPAQKTNQVTKKPRAAKTVRDNRTPDKKQEPKKQAPKRPEPKRQAETKTARDRDARMCKDRPKDNQPKGGGGSGKKFVPWSGTKYGC